jgi:hypothetical protein
MTQDPLVGRRIGNIGCHDVYWQPARLPFILGGFVFFANPAFLSCLGHRSLTFVPYTAMILLSPVVFIIDYGPMFVLGAIGLFLSMRTHNADEDGFFVALCFGSLFLCSLFDVRRVALKFSKKVGRHFGSPWSSFPVWLCENYVLSRIGGIYKYLLMGSVVLAAPTLITDVRRISTFDKKEEKTYYVNQQDYDAYLRMRQNTSPQDPSERYLQYPGLCPARRTALGDWVTQRIIR